jgi:hypothetical protein
MLHRAYEQLIVQAALDPSFAAHLVSDPRRSALEAGCSPMLAESLVGLRSHSLTGFADALHERIYGSLPLRADAVRQRPGDRAVPDAVRLRVSAGPRQATPSHAHLA